MLGDKIKEFRQKKGFTQQDLADALNVAKSTIGMWENNKREPDIETIKKIANALDISLIQLVRDDNTEFRAEANAQPLPSSYIRMVPVFESASAGFGIGAENHITQFIPIYIQSDFEYENTICVHVRGDSMHPQIQDGDIVQVMKQETAETGDIVVILDGDDAYVKRFIRAKQGIILESFNPAYPPMRFTREESNYLRVVGVVKRIIRDI